MANHMSIESHNSFMTNKELSILSMEIDQIALAAGQSLKFQAIIAYFNAAEQYYAKLSALIDSADLEKLESLRKSYYELVELIETYDAYRTRKSLKLLLRIVKDFYFSTRSALQTNGKYYFRTSEKRDKGLSEISFDYEGTNVLEGER